MVGIYSHTITMTITMTIVRYKHMNMIRCWIVMLIAAQLQHVQLLEQAKRALRISCEKTSSLENLTFLILYLDFC